MAIVVTAGDHYADLKRIKVVGTLVFSGNYTTGGDTLNFNLSLIKSQSAPSYVSFNNLSKYLLKFVKGTGLTDNKVKIIVPDTGLELAQAAYPAALTGDTVTYEATFAKFI